MERSESSQLSMTNQEMGMPSESVNNKKQRKAPTKKANDLDGKTWQRNSISVWSDIRKSSEELKLKHPAMFPLSLALRTIQCFTNTNDGVILDPFMGIGSTVIAAELMGKTGIGLDISKLYCEKASKRQIVVSYPFDENGVSLGKSYKDIRLPNETGERQIHNDSATNLKKYVKDASVDFVVTSPPYWDILLQNRSADQKETRHYGNANTDLGRIRDYSEFIGALEDVFSLVYEALKPGKYCCVIVMDLRKKDKFFPYHSDIASMMQKIGFIYDDLIIWDRRHEYNNMRPLGYPYVFRVNKAHEFILIFQKPETPNES